MITIQNGRPDPRANISAEMPRRAGTDRLSRRDILRALGAVGLGTMTGAAAHGFLYERHHIYITRQDIGVPGWPESLSGFRIGFISDLHRSSTVPHEMIAKAVSVLMGESPDLIVLGGDYVTNRDRRFVQPAADALAGLSAKDGVYAVLGNHDDEREVPAALSALGYVVLKDARTRIAIRGEILDLAGLRYWTRRMPEITRVIRGASPNLILIAHTPSRLIEAAALSIPLMLSGHTHGGQIVLPGLGAIAARNFPVISGSARRENTAVFVTRGVGTVYVPIRLNCPPEVAVLTLRPTA
jgi:predicted MPP superfamily phosphohydrolase